MTAPAINFTKVYYTYPDGHAALHDISLTIARGESVALVGANSAGKSTLLQLCSGCLRPTAGEVCVLDMPVDAAHLQAIRREVGTIFQDADDQLFMPTIAEDVAFGPRNMGLDAAEVTQRVNEALTAVGCAHLAERQPRHLSGGEKRAAAIATVLAMRPHVLLLDEPTANLDPYARRNFIHLMGGLPYTRLIATHDLDLVLDLCPRTIILHQGRVMADGDTRTLFADSALLAACRLEPPLRMQPLPPHPA